MNAAPFVPAAARDAMLGALGIAALYTLSDLRAPARAGGYRSPIMAAYVRSMGGDSDGLDL